MDNKYRVTLTLSVIEMRALALMLEQGGGADPYAAPRLALGDMPCMLREQANKILEEGPERYSAAIASPDERLVSLNNRRGYIV